MKAATLIFAFQLLMLVSFGQSKEKYSGTKDPNKTTQTVEAACGQCQFGLPGEGCDLAIRINGKAHFVDGTAIDDHGDAHAKDGFCNAIRSAEVQGKIDNDRFQSTYFKLVKAEQKNKSKGHH